ncbi:DUF3857 domain-containing protein [Pedobacter sp. GR22-6]|uniref:DUF3857 domain-containing protein n=1 Tax=Pedobacter sp. GR22-6 TaxID=3127957 RepID=UPI00307E20D7
MKSSTLPFCSFFTLKVAIVYFFLFGIHTLVYGQSKNFSVNRQNPSWIIKTELKGARPLDKDISDGYYLSVYENQNHVELQEEYTHIVREIVSDAGVQNGSQISVTYDPSFQKLIFHQIIVKRNGKTSDQLAAPRFKVLQNEKDLSKFIYSGTYDAFLLLEDVRKGDQIEYAYTIRGSNPIFGSKYASSFYFEGSSSIGQLYMNLIASGNRKMQFKNFNGAPAAKITAQNGYNIYEWTSRLTKTHRIADYEPSWYNPLKRTQFSEYQSWNEIVYWGLNINSYPNLNSPLLNKKITELKAESGSNKKKYIELATRFVQDEIRYMGIEMGVYSHRPNSPEQVLKQRYGDCKDKSLLLQHLLSAEHIAAYMVYADTESTIRTNEYLPSPFVFNHVIVAVDYAGKRTWIDPTISYQRAKFDDFYAPDYGHVLVIKPGVNALERMVSKPKGKLVAKLSFDVADTSDNKKSTLLIKSKYTGNYADNIRSAIAESGTDGLEKDYLEYYGKYYTDISSAAPIKILDNEKDNTVELTEKYEIENIWTTSEDSDEKRVYFYADMLSSELRNLKAKKRLEPVMLKHPVNIEQELDIRMPYNYSNDNETTTIENSNYFFELSTSGSGKTINYKYTYRSLKDHIEGSEIMDYVKDYKKVDRQLSYYYVAGGLSSSLTSDLNAYAVLAVVLTSMIFSVFCIKIYQKRTDFDTEKLTRAKPIAGWLILLAIRVLLGPVVITTKFITLNIFNNDLWFQLNQMENLKGNLLTIVYGIYLLGNSLLIPYSILCIFLFFNRRESFPIQYSIFTRLMICSAVLSSLLTLFTAGDSYLDYNTGYQIGKLLGSISISVICILYLKKSQRVRETFVFTYPESEWTKAMIRYYNHKLIQKQTVPAEETVEIDEKHENI